jgi:hypothetical protein
MKERTEGRLGFRLGQARLGQVINLKECHFNFEKMLFDQSTPSQIAAYFDLSTFSKEKFQKKKKKPS